MVTAVVTGQAHAVPPAVSHQGLWDDYFRAHFAGDHMAERVWRAAGIRTRHGVTMPPAVDVSRWGTGARMERYVSEALPLGKEALAAALARAGLDAGDVGLFGVATCTGYATPGVDILLARDLGMAPDVQRLLVGHMGCYAAVPALGAVADYVTARARPAVLLCIELTSLHLQPPPASAGEGVPLDRQGLEQVVAHALFADAAAATVVEPGVGGGLAVVDVVAHTDPATSDHMSWDVTDLGFRMGLSPWVPDVLARHVRPVVSGLLERHGLAVGDVAGWAVHPGGRRILEVIGERLDLDDAAMAPAYDILREYGNCSSATVLLVLEHLRDTRSLAPGDHVVAMAFGPGLTLYAALLRVTS
ncbi:MAG: type III polyketide synthase [Streptosporangiaceae bacterium]